MIQYFFVDPDAEPLIRSLGIVSTALALTPHRIPRSDRVTSSSATGSAIECWLANPGVVMSGTGNTLSWAGHHRDVSSHGDISARRRPAGMIPPRLLDHPRRRSKWRRPTCVRSGYLAWRDGRARAEPHGGCVLLQATRDDGCSPALADDDRRFRRRLRLNSSGSPSQSRHDATPIGFGARRRTCTGSSGNFTKQTARSCP